MGARVLIADIDAAMGEHKAREIGADFVRIDLTDYEAVAAALAPRESIEILVNCGGADQHAFFTRTDPCDWNRLLALNLGAVLNVTHVVLPHMQEAGYGRIVNVSSEAGRLGSRGGAVYASAKGGVIAFTRSIARESGRKGITANVVAPGPVDTPMLRRAVETGGEKLLQAMTAATLVGRLGEPEEIAAAIAFLASEEAGFITGEVLGVSGGMGCGA
jgi:NAD(P)-dependent dehydrogenase (short-subunit alcohol dehydrogenase family)